MYLSLSLFIVNSEDFFASEVPTPKSKKTRDSTTELTKMNKAYLLSPYYLMKIGSVKKEIRFNPNRYRKFAPELMMIFFLEDITGCGYRIAWTSDLDGY